MNLLEAQTILNDLANHFSISSPAVRWKRRKNPLDMRSWYYVSQHVISLDLSATLCTVLHEFAHALQAARGDSQGHGDTFRYALLDVVVYYFNGEVERYHWKWEYQLIYRWYLRYVQNNSKYAAS